MSIEIVPQEALEPEVVASTARPGVRPPKFAGQFAKIDFDSYPLPVLSLFPFPEAIELEDLRVAVTGLDCQPKSVPWTDLADIPRVLLATGLNEQPLPEQYGGPMRLVVPFLQGYKSVKWLGAIRVFRHDPMGIKRLLGQSKTGRLGRAWKDNYGIVEPDEGASDPV